MTTKIEPKEGFILIVEDDIGLGRLEAERLAPLGFKLRHAASAGEARAILIKAAPDLMLLDYSLPDSNAVDFLKELRESGGAVPPFVIVTGRGDETVAVDSMKCGAVDYIIKSGDFLENLLPAVAKALEKIALLKKLEDARRSTAKNLRLYNFLAQVNLASSRTKDRVLLFRRICEIAVKNGGMRMAWIGRPDNDLGRIIPLCWAGFVDGYLDLIEIDLGVESPRSKGPTGASVSSGELRACSDIASDPLMAPWREKALERNYRSSAAIPLVECGKLAAVLTLYSDQSEFFTGDELELLNEIKADISLALDAISVEEKRCAAQEVLNRTAGQLAHVMDATSVVILTMRHRASGMNIKWVSGNAEALTGFLPVEILLPGWLEKNLHPQDKAMVETGQKDLLRTGSVTQDFRFKKKNGGYFWVHAQLKVVSAEAGEIIGSWTDITPLKESEMRFQELFEKVPVGYQSLDGGGNLLAVNETWTGIFGYTREEALGRNFAEFLSSGSKNAFAASFTAFMASGESAGVELEIKRKDGSVRHIAFNSKAGHNPDGSFKQAHCVAADITEKKKSESRFRDLLDSLPGGVIVRCGPEVIYVNASGLKMMGFKNERALLGREVLTLLPEELRPDFRRRMEEIDSRGIVTPPMPVRLPRHDGSIADIEISGAPIDFGDRKCGLVFFNDISERKKAERLMTEMSNMQRVESLGALAGGIAHDFNNMLTGIMGNLSLLSARSDLDPGAAAIIHDTLEAVNSAKSLTAQLLAFSKGGRPIKKEFCLGTALNEIFQLSTSGTKAACKIEIPEDLWSVNGDENQIKQAVNNLLLNAIQAMPAGGKLELSAGNINCSAVPGLAPGDCARITVSDTGIGIPTQYMDRVFEPYFTTKTAGHGLGLSMTWSVIKNHGGHLEAVSEPGKGTTFTIYLPATGRRIIGTKEQRSEIQKGSGSVLVLEDEEVVSRVIKRMLEQLGYSCRLTSDGTATLDCYRKERAAGRPFDAVIMDLTISGGQGGKEAVRELRKIDPEARVIVSSGYSDEVVMADYKDYGFDAVLPKPYKYEDLAEIMSRLLKK